MPRLGRGNLVAQVGEENRVALLRLGRGHLVSPQHGEGIKRRGLERENQDAYRMGRGNQLAWVLGEDSSSFLSLEWGIVLLRAEEIFGQAVRGGGGRT